MTLETLVEQIKSVPNEHLDDISLYVKYIQCCHNQENVNHSKTNVDYVMSQLDTLCSGTNPLWKQDPQEYVRELRNNDRI